MGTCFKTPFFLVEISELPILAGQIALFLADFPILRWVPSFLLGPLGVFLGPLGARFPLRAPARRGAARQTRRQSRVAGEDFAAQRGDADAESGETDALAVCALGGVA